MSHPNNEKSLLLQKRFGPFFLTQALGAFNDNVFKTALVIMITFKSANSLNIDSNILVNLAHMLFILPFFLFSANAGQWADKFEKSALIRKIKLAEIGIMLLASLGFYFNETSLLFLVLFLMGTQSTFFGPIKYGILPQQLDDSELIAGNGLVEMGTFLSILLGTLIAGVLIALDKGEFYVSVTIISIAILGYTASRSIQIAPAVDPNLKLNWNPFTEIAKSFRFIRTNRVVFLSVLGVSWFWFFGATFLAQLPNYTKVHLLGDASLVTLLLATFSIGIGTGSLLCERLSGRTVEIGLVPFGAIGLTFFGIDLYFASPTIAAGATNWLNFLTSWGHLRIIADLFFIGTFGGFYIVPLYALIQQRSEKKYRSRIIAGNNILNALFMVVSTLMAISLFSLGFTILHLFLVTAILNALVAIYIFTLVPEFLMRFLIWILIHTMYRVTHENLESIPDKGAALLVCNHVSFVDALIIGGCIPRPVRFVMYHKIFKIPVLRFVFKTARAIPIAPFKEDPELLEKAFQEISAALKDDELVCIFPEGSLTRNGQIAKFRTGVEKIVNSDPVPVIPLALRGLWGSFFSNRGSAAMNDVPHRFWSRIELAATSSVNPKDVSAELLEERVTALRGDQP